MSRMVSTFERNSCLNPVWTIPLSISTFSLNGIRGRISPKKGNGGKRGFHLSSFLRKTGNFPTMALWGSGLLIRKLRSSTAAHASWKGQFKANRRRHVLIRSPLRAPMSLRPLDGSPTVAPVNESVPSKRIPSRRIPCAGSSMKVPVKTAYEKGVNFHRNQKTAKTV